MSTTNEPTDQAEILARCKWRGAMDTHDYDPEFSQFWNDLPASKRGDLDGITAAALERKPVIQAARRLTSQLSVAHRRFVGSGGTEAEWKETEPEIRRELLRDAALGRPNALSAEDERKIRIAHASGLRAI